MVCLKWLFPALVYKKQFRETAELNDLEWEFCSQSAGVQSVFIIDQVTQALGTLFLLS